MKYFTQLAAPYSTEEKYIGTISQYRAGRWGENLIDNHMAASHWMTKRATYM